MAAKPQERKRHDNALSTLSTAVDALNVAKDISVIAPAQAAFGSVVGFLTMIRDCMANEQEYIELGLNCVNICKALDRGTNGKKQEELGQSVCEAINQLTTTVAEIQRNVNRKSGRTSVSRLLQAKNNQTQIAVWKAELNHILHVFNTELALNTSATVSNIREDVSKIREDLGNQTRLTQTSILGESPPPPPRFCFGRDKLIESLIRLAEALDPIALIGSGGIGKTSIALTVLHHDRIKELFGDNRRFIRCDQFPPSRAHFLTRLSKAIGAGVENPEDLAPLRPFLSSRKIFLILDNVESIVDPQGLNAREIYAVLEELSQFKTICLCITSRMSTVPRHCKRPVIPTLSMEAACDIFYSIYGHGERSATVNDLLQRLDFHPLSITLLATVASHNMWDYDQLAEEWEIHRAQALRTDYDESLAATIELSLASPTFRELGVHARELLGVVAFFPRGINKSNLDRLFPTIPNRKDIFNKFCVLSLTYRSNNAFAMLAPLREYLCPRDPRSSSLLCAAKDSYLNWLSVHLEPGKPNFEEARWITTEDANVEHLLDVFTSIEKESVDLWIACSSFMEHLYWHKNRLVVLGPTIEALPEDHYYKPELLFELSRLFQSVGNYTEQKRLLTHTLKLERKRGNDYEVARSLRRLSDGNRRLGLCEEGIQQVKEALRILERLQDTGGQAQCLISLAWLLYEDNRLDAAEESASLAINLLPEEGQEFRVCQSHRILGEIFRLKGEREKAIRRLETALAIASPFNWHDQLFWIHHSLVELFRNEGEFDNARAHLERAKVHTIDDTYSLGRAASLQAWLWYDQRKFEDARSEALRASDIFENIGAARDLEDCVDLLRNIERGMLSRPTSGELASTATSTSPSPRTDPRHGADHTPEGVQHS